MTEKAGGVVKLFYQFIRRQQVDSLAPFGKSRFGAREGKLDELDRDAGSPDAADDGLGPGNVDGGGDEADAGASLGEEDGHVGHGDHVPLRQEGNQHEVRPRLAFAITGGRRVVVLHDEK